MVPRAVFSGATLAVLFTMGLPGLAIADPWGTNTLDTGAHPDSGSHTYCYSSSVGGDAKPNIQDSEYDALSLKTDANVTFDTSCDLSSSSETDVVWRVDALNPGVLGQTFCEDFDGGHCDQFYSTLDMVQIAIGIDDEIDETSVSCHELGHTVGLTHGGASSDCMASRSSNNPETDIQYRRYGPAHHVPDHINDWF